MKTYIIIMCLVAVGSAVFEGDKMFRLSEVSTDFAQDLHPKLLVGNFSDSNCVFSSYSIFNMLCNMVKGASGPTQVEMYNRTQITRFAGGEMKPHEANYNASEQWRTNKTDGTVSYANYISMNPGTPVTPQFLNFTKTYYPSEVAYHSLNDAPGPEQRINDYFKNKTGGVIKDIVPPGVITSSTQIVLASTFQLFAKWDKAFDRTKTHLANFTPATGKITQVDMMSDDSKQVTYLSNYNGVQVTEVPFTNYRFSFVLVLPPAGSSLADLEKSYAEPGKLLKLFRALDEIRTTQPIHIMMPKFPIQSIFEVSYALQAMGMTKPFDSTQASFLALCKTGRPCIYKYYHKVDFQINENGTVPIPGAPVQRPTLSLGTPTVVYNRPFLFFGRDTNSNITLFQGKFCGK